MAQTSPALGERVVIVVLAVVGVLNLLPGLGLLGVNQLQSLYGVDAIDSTEAILLRHRTLLLALLGAAHCRHRDPVNLMGEDCPRHHPGDLPESGAADLPRAYGDAPSPI